MIDYVAVAQQKHDAARRLRTAFYGIRKQNIPRLEQRTLERLAECITPSYAYDDSRDTHLPHGRPIRSCTRHCSKVAVMFSEAHRAVVLYWELVRTDEAIGLFHLIDRLEYYAEHGLKGCELLGGPAGGYTLYNPPVKGR